MIRKAKIQDAEKIRELVNFFAHKDQMLPLSLNEVYERLRDFSVHEENGGICGCVALHVSWTDLAEVRSLAVREDMQGKKIGKNLVEAVLAEAKSMDIPRVFSLTYIPEFFQKFGFRKIDKSELPHKIWADCLKCPKFPDCDEVALMLELRSSK